MNPGIAEFESKFRGLCECVEKEEYPNTLAVFNMVIALGFRLPFMVIALSSVAPFELSRQLLNVRQPPFLDGHLRVLSHRSALPPTAR